MIDVIVLLMLVWAFFHVMSKFGDKKWFKYYMLAGLFILNPILFVVGLVIWSLLRNQIALSTLANGCTHDSACERTVITVNPKVKKS